MITVFIPDNDYPDSDRCRLDITDDDVAIQREYLKRNSQNWEMDSGVRLTKSQMRQLVTEWQKMMGER